MPHTCKDVPFAFKPYCMKYAMDLGYTKLLWLDSSIVCKTDLADIFEIISARGYLFASEIHSVGEFCSDAALKTLDISRELAFTLPSCAAAVIGLDLRQPRSQEFLNSWLALANDGITFHGPKWSGVYGWPRTVSANPAVKGHRHDQTAASVIACRLGMSDWLSYSEYTSLFLNDRFSVRETIEDNSLPRHIWYTRMLKRRLRWRAIWLLRKIKSMRSHPSNYSE
jgi:hypothetical protein